MNVVLCNYIPKRPSKLSDYKSSFMFERFLEIKSG